MAWPPTKPRCAPSRATIMRKGCRHVNCRSTSCSIRRPTSVIGSEPRRTNQDTTSIADLALQPRTYAAVVLEHNVDALALESQRVGRDDPFEQRPDNELKRVVAPPGSLHRQQRLEGLRAAHAKQAVEADRTFEAAPRS